MSIGATPLARRVGVAAVVLLVGMLGLFLLIGRGPDHPPTPAPRAPEQSRDLRLGKPPPNIVGTAIDGRSVNLAALRGKGVLVNFFASWCTECRLESPDIEAAYRSRHDAGFEVIGVNALETGDGPAFYREVGSTYPAVLDPRSGREPGPISQAYGVFQGLPLSVFVGRDGNVHRVYPGRIDAEIIRDELRGMGIN